ncbi:MAG: hypothetical protein J7641_14155 [Cyanobacteria bacterium SID2]|nr:hypothetical protein [Cyanobacteria bacterium SID2]MBP0004360.1 hypothetical protein [Cyanobacteria bacterium SBC]
MSQERNANNSSWNNIALVVLGGIIVAVFLGTTRGSITPPISTENKTVCITTGYVKFFKSPTHPREVVRDDEGNTVQARRGEEVIVISSNAELGRYGNGKIKFIKVQNDNKNSGWIIKKNTASDCP